jgi:hypothetical protein
MRHSHTVMIPLARLAGHPPNMPRQARSSRQTSTLHPQAIRNPELALSHVQSRSHAVS